MLRSCWLSLSIVARSASSLSAAAGAKSADHDVGDRILIVVLPDVALDRLFDVLRGRASAAAPARRRGSPCRASATAAFQRTSGAASCERRAQRGYLRVARAARPSA